MNNLLQSLKFTVGCLLVMGNIATAQITDKPNLEFEVAINNVEQKLEITWKNCLENSIVKLLDNNLHPIKTEALCRNKDGVIDISSLQNDLYYVQVEHYTGVGIQPIIKEPKDVSSNHNLKELKPNLNINVYPNPVQNEVTIQIDEFESKGVLTILNLEGKKVQTQTINSSQIVLDISDLTQGVYFIRVEHEAGIGVQRMVKG